MLPGGRTGIDLSIQKAELGLIRNSNGTSITLNDDADEARFTAMLDRVLKTGSLRVNELTLNVANQLGEILLAGLKVDFLVEQDQQQRALQLLIKNQDAFKEVEIKSLGVRGQTLSKDAQWYIQFNQFKLAQLNEFIKKIQTP